MDKKRSRLAACPGKAALPALFLLSLGFTLWLAVQIPYTHDDWDWGLPIGVRHLLTADINSRYLGNLIVVVLTRSPLLKTLAMGLGLSLIPLFAAELALSLRSGDGDAGSGAAVSAFLRQPSA